jgi:hypothetical protein
MQRAAAERRRLPAAQRGQGEGTHQRAARHCALWVAQLTHLHTLGIACETGTEESPGLPAGPCLPPSLRHVCTCAGAHLEVHQGSLSFPALAWLPPGTTHFQASACACAFGARRAPASTTFQFVVELQAPEEPRCMPGISQPGSAGLIDPTPLIECRTLCLSGQDVTLYLPGSFFATPAMSRDQHGLPCEPASASLSAMALPAVCLVPQQHSQGARAAHSNPLSLEVGIMSHLRRPAEERAPLALQP